MSLEALLAENTNVMRDLIAALLTTSKPMLGDAAPGVDRVIKAQKDADAKKSSGKPSTPAPATVSAEENPDGTLIDKEPADVVLQPRHEKTAALYEQLKDGKPELANVQKAVLGINSNIGREQATALLQRFGAQAITAKPDKKGLDEAQYPEVFALALEVLAGRVDATASMVTE